MKTKSSSKQNFVVINGRRVSADSGKSLDGPTRSGQSLPHNLDLRPEHKKNPVNISTAGQARTLDGFRKVNPAGSNRKRHVKQTPAKKLHKKTTVASTAHSRSVSNANGNTPDKPTVESRSSLRNQRPASKAELQTAKLTQARAQRSSLHRQHNQVSRFGSLHNFGAPKPESAEDTVEHTYAVKPLVAELGSIIAQHNTQHALPPEGAKQEKSHELPEERKIHLRGLLTARRTVSYAATVLVVIVIAGYAAYLNAPNISMRVAAARSGVEAQMPDYQPSGFSQTGPIEYQQGQVVIAFGSNTDSRKFDITQRNSQWDSASLLANYVEPVSNEYDVIEEGGLTIYVYNGSNAAWVNKGIWYTVEGQSLLSPQQIASIATSF